MNGNHLVRLTAAAVAVSFVAMLGGIGLAGRAAEKPIVIGASISQTGAYANDASYALQGYQLWVAQQNGKGGLLGRKLELKVYDDQSDPATAVRDYQRLLDQDHVDLIVGPYASNITASVANIAQQHRMPMISPEVAATAPFLRGLTYIFQGISQAGRYVAGPMEIAKAHGYTAVAITGEDTLFPRAVVADAGDIAKKLGVTIVFSQLYPHNAADYASIVQKIKDANPQAVISASYYPDSVGLLRQLKQSNVTPKLVWLGVGPTELSFGSEVGPDSNGVMGVANWSATLKTADNPEFVQAFTKMFNRPPDYHAAANYSALEVLGAAIKRVGSLNQDAIRDQLDTVVMPTVMGTYHVDPKTGIQLGYQSLVIQWQDGKQYVIYPKKFAQRDALVPFAGWAGR